MKAIFGLVFLSLTSFSFAEVPQTDVEAALKKMVADKVISPEDAVKALARMKGMSADQWKAIEAQATKVAAAKATRTPASVGGADQIKEYEGKFEKAQLNQIEDDMKRMLPEHE